MNTNKAFAHASNLAECNPGIYRRRVIIIGSSGEVRADMEDDVHRYGVIVCHDGYQVTSVVLDNRHIRAPWSLCSLAQDNLSRLVGMSLSSDAMEVYRYTNGKEQCTHMFDCAGLAIAHAAQGTVRRQYDVSIDCRAGAILDENSLPRPIGPQDALLIRDGQVVFSWVIDGTQVLSPEPYSGQEMVGLMSWAKKHVDDPDEREAIGVMRRAMLVSISRAKNMDKIMKPGRSSPRGACFVFQPDRVDQVVRVVGSGRDFTDYPERLLDDISRL
ncbi:MAG: DUF2889 domain-containing protein [Georgfuchsia sp.]